MTNDELDAIEAFRDAVEDGAKLRALWTVTNISQKERFKC